MAPVGVDNWYNALHTVLSRVNKAEVVTMLHRDGLRSSHIGAGWVVYKTSYGPFSPLLNACLCTCALKSFCVYLGELRSELALHGLTILMQVSVLSVPHCP